MSEKKTYKVECYDSKGNKTYIEQEDHDTKFVVDKDYIESQKGKEFTAEYGVFSIKDGKVTKTGDVHWRTIEDDAEDE